MRKTIIVLLSLALILALGIPALADIQVDVYDQDKQLAKSVVFALGVKEYFADNKTPGVKMDVAPFIENGRTFVPIRYLSNALGVTDEFIGWESPTVTLSEPGFPVVELSVGKKEITSDGKTKAIDTSPLLREGRTFLPARFVAEALGYQVDWDPVNRVVIAWPRGEPKPDVKPVLDHLKGQVPNQPSPPVDPNKPADVAKLERIHGVAMTKTFDSRWDYVPPREVTMANRDRSFYTLYWSRGDSIRVGIAWDRILPDIRGVEMDLTPIRKTLDGFFPGHPQIPEIMAKAEEMAEIHRASNRFEKHEAVNYHLNGQRVMLQSGGGYFVTLSIVY